MSIKDISFELNDFIRDEVGVHFIGLLFNEHKLGPDEYVFCVKSNASISKASCFLGGAKFDLKCSTITDVEKFSTLYGATFPHPEQLDIELSIFVGQTDYRLRLKDMKVLPVTGDAVV